MAANSKIEWCDHTFNPWRGCTKVSAGCAHCYAETLSGRNPGTLGVWGPNGTRVVASESMWKEPVKWNRNAAKAGERHRVFCASLADVFEDWLGAMVDATGGRLFNNPNDWQTIPHVYQKHVPERGWLTMSNVRLRLFSLIDSTPNLDWLLLTKRPENIGRMLPSEDESGLAEAIFGYKGKLVKTRPNVWLGTSIENQRTADERIPHLLKVPAAVRFLSMEPLLGPVDMSRYIGYNSEHENTEQRDRNLRSRSFGASGDHAGRNYLEGGRDARKPMEWGGDVTEDASMPSGTRSGAVLSSTANGTREADVLPCSSAGMDALQRSDSTNIADQSHQREQEGQPTKEPRISDTITKRQARGSGATSRASGESIRTKEPCGQADGPTGRSGAGDLCFRDGDAGTDSKAVQGLSSNHIQDSSRGQANNSERADGGLHITTQQRRWQPPIGLVIVGGESGPGARPCRIEWIRDIIRQCRAAGVPCFVRQLGSNSWADNEHGKPHGPCPWNGDRKGGNPDEWPADLRVREFPQALTERSR